MTTQKEVRMLLNAVMRTVNKWVEFVDDRAPRPFKRTKITTDELTITITRENHRRSSSAAASKKGKKKR